MDSQNEAEVEDEYSFLTEAEVKILENLVSSPYVNPFVALDEKRDRLNLERAELPRRRHKNYGLWALFSRPTFRFVKSYIIKKGFLDGDVDVLKWDPLLDILETVEDVVGVLEALSVVHRDVGLTLRNVYDESVDLGVGL